MFLAVIGAGDYDVSWLYLLKPWMNDSLMPKTSGMVVDGDQIKELREVDLNLSPATLHSPVSWCVLWAPGLTS